MIVFCEDCGSKNSLTDQSARAQRLIFTCGQCGYPNNYAVSDDPAPKFLQACDDPAGKYQPLVAALSALPEIIGAFVFRNTKELLAFKMPQSMSERSMTAMGTLLKQAYDGPKQVYDGIGDMVMVIEKKAVLVKSLGHSEFLVAVASRFPLTEAARAELNRLTSPYEENMT
ncbi:MAG TPA: hypothetical protein DHV36_03850 [Desulfobacteraceae bacterium]|nr:hypothetical protein [Desulfobacteraceae bacterium]